MPTFLIDAHQDIAWNSLTFGRDNTLSALEVRRLEEGTDIPSHNFGQRLVGWPEYQQGLVGIIFCSLFASPIRFTEGAWDNRVYRSPTDARRLYRMDLDYYRRLVDENPDKFRLILTRQDLESSLDLWRQPVEDFPNGRPVGLVMSMEGAEAILTPNEVHEWCEWGVRVIGPAWASNQYTGGTREPGGLTAAGIRLVAAMAELGIPLDIAHMDPAAALKAMEVHSGTILASHANPLALLGENPENRHLPDEVIREVIAHDGVIGIMPYNKFLKRGWVITTADAKWSVSLEDVVNHIDYICQTAGSSRHAGIGSDFDGGVGLVSVPREINTIADLQKLETHLAGRGYSSTDISAIFNGNWARILQKAYH